jgi:four helix bundle protein
VSPVPSFEDWDAGADDGFRADPLWRMTAYRLAVYMLEAGWEDAKALHRSPLTKFVAMQLYRALGSIVANIAEGYSRSSGSDRARMFEYALGSAREARAWYLTARPILGAKVIALRTKPLDRICALLLTAIPSERKRQLRPDAQTLDTLEKPPAGSRAQGAARRTKDAS